MLDWVKGRALVMPRPRKVLALLSREILQPLSLWVYGEVMLDAVKVAKIEDEKFGGYTGRGPQFKESAPANGVSSVSTPAGVCDWLVPLSSTSSNPPSWRD